MSISRRKFLVGTGLVGGGLIVGISLNRDGLPYPAAIEGSFNPNAWLQITEDGRFLFQLHKTEMGQGVDSALPIILCEELDLDFKRLELQNAGIHPDFSDPASGGQMTGGSSSVSNSFADLRQAGAAARAMVIAAAAEQWQVADVDCSTDNGVVFGPNEGQQLNYSQLANAAKSFSDVEFSVKDNSDFSLIGKLSPRLDIQSKIDGTALFGIDFDLPGIKTAVIVRCPHFGGKVHSWDKSSIADNSGFITAFEVHSGIAIVANSYWQARKAANQLTVEWDKGPIASLDSANIKQQQQSLLASEEPRIALEKGDLKSSDEHSRSALTVNYSVPFTHHSPMEPQNSSALVTTAGSARVDGRILDHDSMEMWVPSQSPQISQSVAAHYTAFKTDQITINTLLMGGGFGRRGYADFAGEAAVIAEQLPGTPVKLVWSREDDMRHDFYRASSEHQISAALDTDGKLVSWQHTLVASSIIKTMAVSMAVNMLPEWVPPAMAESLGKKGGNFIAGYDPIPSEGAKIVYDVENIQVGSIEYDSGVPTGFWRSVGFSYNVFVVESFIDEMADVAKADPLIFRLAHLDQAPRYKAVLELAAENAGWGNQPEGVFQGIAVSEPFSSFCAMVVDISVSDAGYVIEKVVAAVDCGLVINPDIVAAQIEGGIIYALSAAIKSPVTFAEGATMQSNFHDLPVVRMNEIPKKIEVYTVQGQDTPTGIGEIGVPSLAPALANAIFAATGRRIRDLPIDMSS